MPVPMGEKCWIEVPAVATPWALQRTRRATRRGLDAASVKPDSTFSAIHHQIVNGIALLH
jgi:hypothetical protein